MPPPYFCDWNAGAPALEEVLAAFVAAERTAPANPSSVHTAGRRARAILEEARQRIASAFDVAPTDVVFTSGGTEAANLAVLGLGDPRLPVVVAPTEHPAVFEAARRRGLREWTVDATGAATITDPGPGVGLLGLVHGQSELGTLQPTSAVGSLARQLQVPWFVDAAQTLGREPLRPVVEAGAVVALSPHKVGGLRGHGALLGHGLQAKLRPLLHGGAQEFGLRPGTPSPALAAANALAIELAVREQVPRNAAMLAARSAFLAGVGASGVRHRILTPLERSLANTAMLFFPGVDGRNLVPTLDLAGVHASHGSACSSGAPTPPRILGAIGLDEAAARACVRFSFGWREDIATVRAAGELVGAIVGARQKKN